MKLWFHECFSPDGWPAPWAYCSDVHTHLMEALSSPPEFTPRRLLLQVEAEGCLGPGWGWGDTVVALRTTCQGDRHKLLEFWEYKAI